MPNKFSDVQRDHIRKEFQAYGKIKAIRLYRLYTNCTLKEAKDGVESLCSEGKWDDLEPDEPAEIVISIGGFSALWDARSKELRIPFARADMADEAMSEISMRLERAKP